MNKHKALRAHRRRQNRALMGDFVPEDIHAYSLDRSTFTIFLNGTAWRVGEEHEMEQGEPGVEFTMADTFARNIHILSNIDKSRPILVNMSSCGGYWHEGKKIMGAILGCPNPTTILATKWARSMTSMIALAADCFAIEPTADYMYHLGEVGFGGTGRLFETEFLEYRKDTERMLRIYTARLKERGIYAHLPEDKIRNVLVKNMEKYEDVWLSAGEAVRWGFADKLFLGDHEKLRATKRNEARRKKMFEIMSQSISIEVRVS